MVASATGVPRHPCFFAQQAVEKMLKACLIFEAIQLPRSHDLDSLRDVLPNAWHVKVTQPTFGRLVDFAVGARYPDARITATAADAVAAMVQARDVWNSVTNDLKSRGFDIAEELP